MCEYFRSSKPRKYKGPLSEIDYKYLWYQEVEFTPDSFYEGLEFLLKKGTNTNIDVLIYYMENNEKKELDLPVFIENGKSTKHIWTKMGEIDESGIDIDSVIILRQKPTADVAGLHLIQTLCETETITGEKCGKYLIKLMNNMSQYPNVIMGIRCYKAGAIYRILGSIFPHLPITPHKSAVISILHHILSRTTTIVEMDRGDRSVFKNSWNKFIWEIKQLSRGIQYNLPVFNAATISPSEHQPLYELSCERVDKLLNRNIKIGKGNPEWMIPYVFLNTYVSNKNMTRISVDLWHEIIGIHTEYNVGMITKYNEKTWTGSGLEKIVNDTMAHFHMKTLKSQNLDKQEMISNVKEFMDTYGIRRRSCPDSFNKILATE